MQLRQMEIVTDKDKLSVDIQATCMKYKTIKQWAYILHDKDDTRPHYHIYLNFGTSSCDTSLVAKWFNLPENFIEKVKGRKVDVLLYLTHGNDTQKNKHQYSPSEVVANFDFGSEIEQSKIIGDFEHYSYAEQVAYVNTLPISEKATAFTRLKKLWELECQCASLITDRQIKVGFIDGKAGAGKTYYAKQLCKSLELDFCISSSSNDPFQDYLGQNAIILDDMRDKTFKYLDDLLKIIDNNTSSSVSSRFHNKVFNGKLILITSSVPLHYWYPEYKYSSFDTLTQLYRRISFYVHVDRESIYYYDGGVDDSGKPKGEASVFINGITELKRERSVDIDILGAFGKIAQTKIVFTGPDGFA